MSDPGQPSRFSDVEAVLRHHMNLEIALTSAEPTSLSKMLVLSYWSHVPAERRTIDRQDWRGLSEKDADRIKNNHLKWFERMLSGDTHIPSTLVWPWIDCLESQKRECMSEMASLGGVRFMVVAPTREYSTLGCVLEEFAQVIESNARIYEDGVVDMNDKEEVLELSRHIDTCMGVLASFRDSMMKASGGVQKETSLLSKDGLAHLVTGLSGDKTHKKTNGTNDPRKDSHAPE